MADHQSDRAINPILRRLEVLLSSGRTYIDDARYEYPLVQYDWSSETAGQIQTILQELNTSVSDVDEHMLDVNIESLIHRWTSKITIPSTSEMNKGTIYRWLTSKDGLNQIKNALLNVLPNIATPTLDKAHRSMINIVLDMKTGGQASHIIKAKRHQYLINLLVETAKGNQPKLEISSCLIMGDPHGMRDIDIAVVITPDVAARYPTLRHAKSFLDMEFLRNKLIEHVNHIHKDNVYDLPPLGATIIVVNRVDDKDIIVATSGGGRIATNNIIASTQQYFRQPNFQSIDKKDSHMPTLLKIEGMDSNFISSMSYVLLWMAQKMKFLIPSLYNKHLMDDDTMPTYREAMQTIYDNPIARILFSRSYIMPHLKENVKPTEKQWGIFKSLMWKLSQIS